MNKMNAFPDEFNDGMTLRDYFAAKAMQALLAGGAHPNRYILADDAYKAADAMMEVRDKDE